MTQGERVKTIRKTLGLTLEKFGEKIGLKKNSLSQIENGKNNLTDQSIRSICREYSVNEEWLLNGTGEMFSEIDRDDQLMRWAASALKGNSDSFRKRFVAMLASLRDEDWVFLEEKARMLIDLREHSEDN